MIVCDGFKAGSVLVLLDLSGVGTDFIAERRGGLILIGQKTGIPILIGCSGTDWREHMADEGLTFIGP